MTNVTDSYQAYIEERRNREPEPEPVSTLELTQLELEMLAMFVTNESNVVHVPPGATQEAAGEAWRMLVAKLIALHKP